jgi:hypothetical protein
MPPRPRLALISALLVCLCFVSLAGASGQTSLPAWGTEPSPTGSNFLSGISVGSANDIWAVGRTMDQWRSYALTLHYDGSTWTTVPSPTNEGLRLEDVVTLGPNDAWAVGWIGNPSYLDTQSVAMHWNGTAWSIVPTPQPGGTTWPDELFAVDAAAPDDVWATGVYWGDRAIEHSVILHWDGTSWRISRTGHPTPSSAAPVGSPCDTYGGLTGITVVSATDVWAVGDATTCHYDGRFWTEIPSPQPRGEYNEIGYPLQDVSAASPSDIWAVGARVIDDPFTVYWDTLAEHWDGAHWTRVTEIPVGQILLGVDAVASNDVWAVGRDDYGPLIVHYDGSSWSRVPTPEANHAGELAGVDSAAPDDLWAAGNYELGTLIEHAPSSTQGAVVGQTGVAHATVSWFGPENGSTETDVYGGYQVGGLQAGTYTFTATLAGCVPDSRPVTVVAGQTLEEDFHIGCEGSARPR